MHDPITNTTDGWPDDWLIIRKGRHMSKPWDHLRKSVKPPIEPGDWRTSFGARVCVSFIKPYGSAQLLIVESNYFTPTDLRELAEFCTELADQLESA